MPMRDREDLIDIDIPSVQKAMVKVMYDAYEDCRDLNCVSCPDRRKSANNCMRSCILFKYARKLYEAGFVYAEEDVWSAYNDGYACGMEQGIEAERSRKEQKRMNNFIELHDFYRKESVLINTRHITYVTPLFDLESEEYATLINFEAEDSNYTVTESYEEVKRLLALVEYVYKEEE